MADKAKLDKTKIEKIQQEEFMRQGKELIQQGNKRRVVIHTQDGKPVLDLTLTQAGIAGVVLLFLPGGLLITLGGVAFAFMSKLQIEILREIGDDENTIVIEKNKNDEA